jgi:hypothetical protein
MNNREIIYADAFGRKLKVGDVVWFEYKRTKRQGQAVIAELLFCDDLKIARMWSGRGGFVRRRVSELRKEVKPRR